MQFNKISLQFLTAEYEKVAYTLPIPTYRRTVTQTEHQGYVIITYELKHSITSQNQFKWLANIKQSMQKHIKASFKFIEYVESKNQENTTVKYSLMQLQEHFYPVDTTYPQIYLPSNKKEVYQRLCIYASKLYYYNVFHLEMVMYASLKMNELLEKPFSYKELLKKSIIAYKFVINNPPRQKLNKRELNQALKCGGNKRGEQMKQKQQQHQEQIQELLKDDTYIKPNGKPNISAIADKLQVDRKTVTRIMKKIFLCFFPLFFLYPMFFYSFDSVIV